MTLKSLPRVASNVYLPCTSCDREGSYHRVLAHTSSTSAKTQCEICGKKKNLKLDAPKSSGTRRARTTTTTQGEKQFHQLLEQFEETSTPYSIRGQFPKDTVIEHPKFGKGVITASHQDRIQVLFRDGVRDLIQNRK